MPRLRLTQMPAVVFTLLVACGQDAPPPEPVPRAIQWERISGPVAGNQRVISGIVTAIDDTRLAFEIGGTVESVSVDLGYHVEEGQELARLDQEPFELSVRDAEAALAEALALRAQARSTYSRYAEAAKTGAVARQDLDTAQANRSARNSQFEAAEARLNLARRDLRRSVLHAPFRGSISSREIDPAMKVASGQIAFAVDSEESGLRVEVQMPETLIAQVAHGDEAQISFPSVGDQRSDIEDITYRGLVAEVGTRASTGNAFPVRVDLLSPPKGLRSGMTAEVRFTLRDEADGGLVASQGHMVPFQALLPLADDSFAVFVYDKETSTVSKRTVRTGGLRVNEIAVLEGLEEGEIIATAGVSFLRDGQKVTLLRETLGEKRP